MSREPAAGLPCALPFRPRLARFDRPAASLAELLQADGEDFVHLAAWTVLGRRAEPDEHAAWLARLEQSPRHAKGQLITALDELAATAGDPPQLSGLNNYLLLNQRRSTPVVGPLLAGMTALHLRFPGLGWPAKFARSVPGKVRFTYRHSRKFLLKLAGRMQVPNPADMRIALGVVRTPAPEGTEPLVADYYQRLIAAVDGRGRAA